MLNGSKDGESADSGFKADIYAAGVILFNLLSGCMPYSKATPDNELYMKFEKDREGFWEHHEHYSFEGKIAKDLRELLSHTLEPDPEKRWGIKEIKSSAWYNGECASLKLVTKEMGKRKSSVNLAKTFPEKRVEIAKSWTAKSKGRKKKSKIALPSINYESMGRIMWRLCSSLLGL